MNGEGVSAQFARMVREGEKTPAPVFVARYCPNCVQRTPHLSAESGTWETFTCQRCSGETRYRSWRGT